MNQELTISSSIVKYLYDSLPSFRRHPAQDCIEYIEQNKLVADSSKVYDKEIISTIESLPSSDKSEMIKIIVMSWLFNKRYCVDIELPSINFDLLMCNSTTDKIYFNPTFNKKDINRIKKCSQIEPHSVETFINPQPSDRIKHLPTLILLDKDCFYDLVTIVSPFIKNAKSLEIIDPYLFNPIAIINLNIILDLNPSASITLRILNRKKVEPCRIMEYDEFLSELRPRLSSHQKIEIIEIWSGHVERYILTEEIQIYLPGGLDSIKKNGQPNFDENWKKAEIRIENRK